MEIVGDCERGVGRFGERKKKGWVLGSGGDDDVGELGKRKGCFWFGETLEQGFQNVGLCGYRWSECF